MPNLRLDPVTGRFVIVASNRAARPDEYRSSNHDVPTATGCPFCPGHEADTPTAVITYPPRRSAVESQNWQVRVVPNLYPAVYPESSDGHVRPLSTERLFQQSPSLGVHEVLIESPRHVRSISDQTVEEASLVFCAYRDRMLAMRQTDALAWALIFKNVGEAAGASLEHIHSQLTGLHNVPPEIRQELNNAENYFRKNHSCLFCEINRREVQCRDRIVMKTPNFVAFCPFFSRNAYETWILPWDHCSHFERTGDNLLPELARIVHFCVSRIETAAHCRAYNYFIHSAPFDTEAAAHYHWHLEIIPRTAMIGGFEWGTGCFINTVPPEEAAARLRESEPAPVIAE